MFRSTNQYIAPLGVFLSVIIEPGCCRKSFSFLGSELKMEKIKMVHTEHCASHYRTPAKPKINFSFLCDVCISFYISGTTFLILP